MAALPKAWGCRTGAWTAGSSQRAAQSPGVTGPDTGALPEPVRRFWPDAGGGVSGRGRRAEGRSRHAAALAGPRRSLAGPAAAATTSAVAGAQGVPGTDGATGRVAPRLV